MRCVKVYGKMDRHGECLLTCACSSVWAYQSTWTTSEWLEKKQNVKPMWKRLQNNIDHEDPCQILAKDRTSIFGMHARRSKGWMEQTVQSHNRVVHKIRDHLRDGRLRSGERKRFIGKNHGLKLWQERRCCNMLREILRDGKNKVSLLSSRRQHREETITSLHLRLFIRTESTVLHALWSF